MKPFQALRSATSNSRQVLTASASSSIPRFRFMPPPLHPKLTSQTRRRFFVSLSLRLKSASDSKIKPPDRPPSTAKAEHLLPVKKIFLTPNHIFATVGMASLAAILFGGAAFYGGNNRENLTNQVTQLTIPTPAPTNLKNTDISVQPLVLNPITDDIFDHNDNLLVIVLADEAWLQNNEFKKNVMQLIPRIKEEFNFVTPYFTVQPGIEENTEIEKEVKFMCYKGHRKQHFTWSLKEQDNWDEVLELIKEFFKFRSLPNFEVAERGIQTISANQFKEYVLDDSHHWPVIVQLYEETCFLCFLMRPMIQTLCLDKEIFQLPCRIMRINVEENDFPEGLPMARGTPQFFLYHKGKSRRWLEFKPNDFVEKLSETYKLEEETKNHMLELAEKVQTRFQMFTALVMWHMEMKKMEDELAADGSLESLIERARKGNSKDDGFNKMVAQLMQEDMSRLDGIYENMEYLQNEINELERDVCLMGVMLGRKIDDKEKQLSSDHQRAALQENKGTDSEGAEKGKGWWKTNIQSNPTSPSTTTNVNREALRAASQPEAEPTQNRGKTLLEEEASENAPISRKSSEEELTADSVGKSGSGKVRERVEK